MRRGGLFVCIVPFLYQTRLPYGFYIRVEMENGVYGAAILAGVSSLLEGIPGQ